MTHNILRVEVNLKHEHIILRGDFNVYLSLEDLLRQNAFEVLYHKFCEFIVLNLHHVAEAIAVY